MLPKPNHGFAWVQAGARPALVCDALQPLAGHVFTTRPWTIGSAVNAAAGEGWAEVAEAVGVEPRDLVRVRQVHGAAVLRLRSGDHFDPDHLSDADIIVSDAPGRAIAIQTADCVPLLLADRRTGVICAAHAGWRGLAARVPEVAVAAVATGFGSRPDDLVAAIGPAISWCCYEVGGDVRAAFAGSGFSEARIDRWFVSTPRLSAVNPPMPGLGPPRAGHEYFDGWGAARDQLEAAGVPLAQITVAELCSASHPQWLCSYRRDGKAAGRMAAAIRPRTRAGEHNV
jgi:purine-nucleoside/S-methyl-5'-thioadenosine phosphorylase / adenosine deaminase